MSTRGLKDRFLRIGVCLLSFSFFLIAYMSNKNVAEMNLWRWSESSAAKYSILAVGDGVWWQDGCVRGMHGPKV